MVGIGSGLDERVDMSVISSIRSNPIRSDSM